MKGPVAASKWKLRKMPQKTLFTEVKIEMSIIRSKRLVRI